MAAAAIIKNSKWSSEVTIPAPMLDNGNWLNRPNNQRTVTIKENFDKQNIVKDFSKNIKSEVENTLKKENLDAPALDLVVEQEKREIEAESLILEVNSTPKAEKKASESENYDPTLDLPKYQYPTINLLTEYPIKDVRVSKEELESNKNNISTHN